jgi:hypothetical protein
MGQRRVSVFSLKAAGRFGRVLIEGTGNPAPFIRPDLKRSGKGELKFAHPRFSRKNMAWGAESKGFQVKGTC